jgi:hypothetical protein
MVSAFKRISILAAAPLALFAQINVTGTSVTATQAILQYTAPIQGACSLRVADMDRSLAMASATQSAGQVTVQTNSPHGLLIGAVIYIENSGVSAWNAWQTITAVPSPSSFTFSNATAGTSASGNVGVLVDDVNPALFSGSDQDSRPGNITAGQMPVAGQRPSPAAPAGRTRTFAIGLRNAQFASDGDRHSRALQTNARHHFTLTCGTQSFDQEFRTQNIPLGDTHNEGPLADRTNPGQYAYPGVQWSNPSQTLIDPLTGLRSFRATSPLGTPSTTQNFATAIDAQSAWQNPAAPLANTSAAATFTGPCSSGTCPLFLRADTLSMYGGSVYASQGSSLDWITVTVNNASISNPNCSGDDCKVVACLTVNGITCTSGTQETALTATPASYTFGSQALMNLWQGSGQPAIIRPDVSLATGTVSYTAATKQVTLVSGSPFSIKWTAGSAINIGGAQYTISSLQSERQLTLSAGPVSDQSSVTYSANNFGVLIWKKTAAADRISVGYATFLYGSTVMPGWGAAPEYEQDCSSIVNVSGKAGYNCFVNQELYWVAADGSDLRDLGQVALAPTADGKWPGYQVCGQSGVAYQFDPQNGDTWYCVVVLYFDQQRISIVKVQYTGDHSRYTPGQILPLCGQGVPQPCLLATVMQPNKSDSVSQAGPLFNPDYAATGYQTVYIAWGGVSPDGDIELYTRSTGQDSPGWVFMFTIGDGTPTGTTPNSLHAIASASSYRTPPASWCTIHATSPPESGWVVFASNNLGLYGAANYTMTLTSAPLTPNVGGGGGLSVCPANPFGVIGTVCTTITVNGPPAAPGGPITPTFLQNIQVGDLLQVGCSGCGLDLEVFRVLAIASTTQMTVQRGYIYPISSHAGTVITAVCGTQNIQGSKTGVWNYRSDPYGTNVNGQTMIVDTTILNGHTYTGSGVYITAGGFPYDLGPLCPIALLTSGGACNQVRFGNVATAIQSQANAIAINPAFAGVFGIGSPNEVDSHPGPCFNTWCMDARPMDGGSIGTLNPFVQVSGQLWMSTGAQSILNRKLLPTMAYVGRFALVDVSGPGSVIGSGPQDSYEYCYVSVAGECQPGSPVGAVYVNAPYISYPSCAYPGIANQSDDTNAICIGSLGAYTGNIVQYGVIQHDLTGAGFRRLGPNYSTWNQQNVFWNVAVTPNSALIESWARWLDGVAHEDLITVLPPYPSQDGVTRNTFIPVPVVVDPPPGGGVQSAIVEFGYAENGDPGSFYCTSRQEACVAASGSVNTATPFYFEQSESYSGVPCATGCTIAIPAFSQRAVYYRWKYLGSSGQVVESSKVHVVLTP